jgi:hypothetical protein
VWDSSFPLYREGGIALKRILLVLSVALVMAVMLSVYIAALAFAKQPENEFRDDLCKNGGWQDFGFSDQGECVSAGNHGELTTV